MASPAQAEALLAAVARIRPDLAAFFGCLYYGALRPEEAIALRLPTATCPAAAGACSPSPPPPRTAAAWTGNGTSHEQRGLKHRPEGAVRTVPIPPVLVAMLRPHYRCYGTAPDGRLFRGTRGGPLSESSLRPHLARRPHPGPRPGAAATALARRPYDLRHAALSLWLNAGAAPAQIAHGPGTASPCCWPSTPTASTARTTSPTGRSSMPCAPATRHRAGKQAVPRTAGTAPILSAICPCMASQARAWPAIARSSQARTVRIPPPHLSVVSPAQTAYEPLARAAADRRIWPTHGPQTKQAVCGTACLHVKAADAIPRQRL